MNGCLCFVFGVGFLVMVRLCRSQVWVFVGLIIVLIFRQLVMFSVLLLWQVLFIMLWNSVLCCWGFFLVVSFLVKFSCIVFFRFMVLNLLLGQVMVNSGEWKLFVVMVWVFSLQFLCRIMVKNGIVRLVVLMNICEMWCIVVCFFVFGLIMKLGVLQSEMIGMLKVLYNCMKCVVLLLVVVSMVLLRWLGLLVIRLNVWFSMCSSVVIRLGVNWCCSFSMLFWLVRILIVWWMLQVCRWFFGIRWCNLCWLV